MQNQENELDLISLLVKLILACLLVIGIYYGNRYFAREKAKKREQIEKSLKPRPKTFKFMVEEDTMT